LSGLAGSIENVSELLESAEDRRPKGGGARFRTLQDAICFDGVTFRYEGESKAAALDNMSVRIEAGKITAIVGPSGAGKTTLVHLICRFYDVSEGCIHVDGEPLPSLDLETWRRRIGLANQDTHLFSASVEENIALGAGRATRGQVIEAATRANAHDFILQLPEGYNTRVGERGQRLSGGQRQRIALARAFVRNPEILLLDEATNALDSVTEEAVSRALRNAVTKPTIIIVAHRMSTIMMADRVIVLDKGRVVQEGRPTDLICADGTFSDLVRPPGLCPLESEDISDTFL
jgi:subfamily B ATP-binding cassette protein MsbA